MNVGLPLTVAVLRALGARFAISTGSLRQRGLAMGYASFVDGVSKGGLRLREMGRRDVCLLCLGGLLPCGKHSMQ